MCSSVPMPRRSSLPKHVLAFPWSKRFSRAFCNLTATSWHQQQRTWQPQQLPWQGTCHSDAQGVTVVPRMSQWRHRVTVMPKVSQWCPECHSDGQDVTVMPKLLQWCPGCHSDAQGAPVMPNVSQWCPGCHCDAQGATLVPIVSQWCPGYPLHSDSPLAQDTIPGVFQPCSPGMFISKLCIYSSVPANGCFGCAQHPPLAAPNPLWLYPTPPHTSGAPLSTAWWVHRAGEGFGHNLTCPEPGSPAWSHSNQHWLTPEARGSEVTL